MNTEIQLFVSSGRMAEASQVDRRTFNRKVELSKIHPDAFLDDGARRVALFTVERYQQLLEMSAEKKNL